MKTPFGASGLRLERTQAAPQVTVRQLGEGDAARYNQFFGQGTLAHPDTLRITVADIAAAPFQTAHGAEGSTFVAVDTAGNWLGVVTVEREQGREKRRTLPGCCACTWTPQTPEPAWVERCCAPRWREPVSFRGSRR